MLEESSFANPPAGGWLSSTPWLCAYWPVRNVARDGQQSGKLTKLFVNVTPRSAISDCTFPITDADAAVWSSVMITTTFGLGLGRLGRARDRAGPGDRACERGYAASERCCEGAAVSGIDSHPGPLNPAQAAKSRTGREEESQSTQKSSMISGSPAW